MKFEFNVDAKSKAFCEAIASEMQRRFGISQGEAVFRINRHWKGQSLLGDHDMVYHEDEDFWAHEILFESSHQLWSVADPKPRSV